METTDNALLFQMNNISIAYNTKRGALKAVQNASFTINTGESVALIGESGCGKTTLATSIVQALPNAAAITDGEMFFRTADGVMADLLKMPRGQIRKLLWDEISMVFQASQSSFNPVTKIRTQFVDTVRAHRKGVSNQQIEDMSVELLETVHLDAKKVLDSFPHEVSGGMKQRALIALSLLLEPKLVILDEPTTALDILTQEKILKLLRKLKTEKGFSLLFITHDLSIVSELADKVVTMYAGCIVESAPVKEFFSDPRHPYSIGLIHAIPRLSDSEDDLYSIPGNPPDLIDIKAGCPFAPRCSRCESRCLTKLPPLAEVGSGHYCACWNPASGGLKNE